MLEPTPKPESTIAETVHRMRTYIESLIVYVANKEYVFLDMICSVCTWNILQATLL